MSLNIHSTWNIKKVWEISWYFCNIWCIVFIWWFCLKCSYICNKICCVRSTTYWPINYKLLCRLLWLNVLIVFRFTVFFIRKTFIQIAVWYMIQGRRGIPAIPAMTFLLLLNYQNLLHMKIFAEGNTTVITNECFTTF